MDENDILQNKGVESVIVQSRKVKGMIVTFYRVDDEKCHLQSKGSKTTRVKHESLKNIRAKIIF